MAAPPEEKHTGLRRLANALRFSVNGIRACFRTEEAFRQEVFLAAFMIPFGLWIGKTHADKYLLAGSVILVLLVELLNTAVERAIDRISFEKHELSKESKDMGSAAVFLSLLMAGLCWTLLALPEIIKLTNLI